VKKHFITVALAALFSTATAFPGQLTILKAVYIGGDVQRDVTPLLVQNVKEGQLIFLVGNQKLGGDPFFGKVKTLTVQYRIDSADFTVTAREGERLVLPNSRAIPIASTSQTPAPQSVVVSAQIPSVTVNQNPSAAASTPPSAAVISPHITLPLEGQDFTTLDGDKYTNTTVKRIEPDGIVVSDADGIRKLKFKNLPPAIGTKYGYDQAKAAEYQTAAQAAAITAQQQAVKVEQSKVNEQAKASAIQEEAAKQASQPHQLFNIMGNVIQKLDSGVLINSTWTAPCGIQFGGPTTVVYITNFPDFDKVYDGQPVIFIASENGTFQYITLDGTTSTVRQFVFQREGTSEGSRIGH
jgi:hypothetical protein